MLFLPKFARVFVESGNLVESRVICDFAPEELDEELIRSLVTHIKFAATACLPECQQLKELTRPAVFPLIYPARR